MVSDSCFVYNNIHIVSLYIYICPYIHIFSICYANLVKYILFVFFFVLLFPDFVLPGSGFVDADGTEMCLEPVQRPANFQPRRTENETKSETNQDTELKKKNDDVSTFKCFPNFWKFETCFSPLLKTRGNSTWQNMWITRRSGQPVNSVDLAFLVDLSQGNVIFFNNNFEWFLAWQIRCLILFFLTFPPTVLLHRQCSAFFQSPSTSFAFFAWQSDPPKLKSCFWCSAQDTSEHAHNTCGSAVSIEDVGSSSVDVSRFSLSGT